MGFFSDLLDLAPHRTVGLKAKEYCINSSISERELHIIRKHGFDEKKFIQKRNSYHMKMFAELFHVLHAQNPNASFQIADASFQMHVRDYWDSFSDSEKNNIEFSVSDWGNRAAWIDLIDSFYTSVSGHDLCELSADDQTQFRELITGYQSGIIGFFKEHARKLNA